jgi:hypothetical protein
MATYSYYDLVSSLRDLVNDYDKLIDEAKLWKGRINTGSLHGLDSFINRARRMLSQTSELLRSIPESDDSGDVMLEYVKTYVAYLRLVSIPYTRDLLEEIRMRLITREKHDEAFAVEEVINAANKLLAPGSRHSPSSQ